MPLPLHLFVSGRPAPQLVLEDPPIHHLPHDEFVEELRRLAGTPEEILQNREILELLLPLLRADFSWARPIASSPRRRLPSRSAPTAASGTWR
jgi:medium-chain acyl-[acyl-carrier-protein] hydrolase